jgi:SNF2 family DNA or RNA helicase
VRIRSQGTSHHGSHESSANDQFQGIDELVSEGQRILLFSQFTSMLALIEEGIATVIGAPRW